MLKLLKYLRPFIVMVCAIVLLLLVQAACDLSLPDYNSHIVNVGIQQGGVENAVPKAIRKSELDKLVLFMNGEEKAKVKKDYTLLEKNRLSEADYTSYVKLYPRLAEEPVYILNAVPKSEIAELNPVMGKDILIASEIGKSGMDPSKIPTSKLRAIRAAADKKTAGLSDSMINQAAVPYIHKEYDALGINTDQMQSNYILYTGGIMILIALLSMAASVTVGYLAARVAAGLGRLLRKEVFRKVTGFSNSEFDQFSTASLITRSTNDIQQIQMLLVMLLRIIFYAPILGVGGVIKVYQDNSSMWWIIALALLAILLLVSSLFGVAIPRFKRVQKLVHRIVNSWTIITPNKFSFY